MGPDNLIPFLSIENTLPATSILNWPLVRVVCVETSFVESNKQIPIFAAAFWGLAYWQKLSHFVQDEQDNKLKFR